MMRNVFGKASESRNASKNEKKKPEKHFFGRFDSKFVQNI